MEMGAVDMSAASRHDLAPEIRKTFVPSRHADVTQLIGGVVGKLDDADAEVREDIHARGVVAHHRRVLETVDDADLARLCGAFDIAGRVDLHKIGAVAPQDFVPDADRADRIFEWLVAATHVAERHIDRGDASLFGVADRTGVDIRRRGINRIVALRPLEREIGVFDPPKSIDDHSPT
jgi:hypothetical protein